VGRQTEEGADCYRAQLLLHCPAGKVRKLIPGYTVKVDHIGCAESNLSKHDIIIIHNWSLVKVALLRRDSRPFDKLRQALGCPGERSLAAIFGGNKFGNGGGASPRWTAEGGCPLRREG
jgi:hypothetical protein